MSVEDYEILKSLPSETAYEYHRIRRHSDAKTFLLCSLKQAQLPFGGSLQEQMKLMQSFSHVEGFARPVGLIDHEGSPALLLEGVGSTSLLEFVGKGRLGTKEALRLALSLAEILKAIHESRRIAHVLHPSHFFVNEYGEGLCLGLLPSSLPFASYRVVWPGLSSLQTYYTDLSCLSPEMTGLSGYALDYRSDFFVLGALLFEWLSGKRPFFSLSGRSHLESLLESEPPRLDQIASDVSPAAGELVMRLLSKSPQERLNTAEEVCEALRSCLSQKTAKSAEPLSYTLQSRPALLLDLPKESQLRVRAKLRDSLKRTLLGKMELCLLSGESGLEKSSLARAFAWDAFKEGCLFLEARPDPEPECRPYSLLASVLDAFVRHLKSSSLEEQAKWQKLFGESAAADFSALCELAPGLSSLFPEGLASESGEFLRLDEFPKENIYFLFLSFLEALASKMRPLVIVLDHLEDADGASLEFLHFLSSQNIEYFLGIFIWSEDRDLPPLLSDWIRRLPEMAQGHVSEVPVLPWQQAELSRQVCAALGAEPKNASALLSLLWSRSKGNPLRLRQTLVAMQRAGLLAFREGRWQWLLDNFRLTQIPENGRQLVHHLLQGASSEERVVLGLLSSMGDYLSVSEVVGLAQGAAPDVRSSLLALSEAGLVRFELDVSSSELVTSGLPSLAFLKEARELYAKELPDMRFPLADEGRWGVSSVLAARACLALESNLPAQSSALVQRVLRISLGTAALGLRWNAERIAHQFFTLIVKILNQRDGAFLEGYVDLVCELAMRLRREKELPSSVLPKNRHRLRELLRLRIQLKKLYNPKSLVRDEGKHAELVRLCEKALRKAGLRLSASRFSFLFVSLRKRVAKILKKHHSVLHPKQNEIVEQEIHLTHEILSYYIRIGVSGDLRTKARLKGLELALRFDVWQRPIELFLAQLISELSADPKADQEVASLYKLLAPLELSAEARAVLVQEARPWTDRYSKWRASIKDAILRTRSLARPELSCNLRLEGLCVDALNEGHSLSDLLSRTHELNRLCRLQNLSKQELLSQKLLQWTQALLEGREFRPLPEAALGLDLLSGIRLHLLHLSECLHTGEPHYADLSAEWLASRVTHKVPPVWAALADFYLSLFWLWQYGSATRQERISLRKKLALQLARLKRNASVFEEGSYRLDFLEALLGNLDVSQARAKPAPLDLAREAASTQGRLLEAALLSRFLGVYYLDQGREDVARSYLSQACRDYEEAGAHAISGTLRERYPEWIDEIAKPASTSEGELAKTEAESKRSGDALVSAIHSERFFVLEPKRLAFEIANYLIEETRALKAAVYLSMDATQRPRLLCLKKASEPESSFEASLAERELPVSLIDSALRSQLPVSVHPVRSPEHLYADDPYIQTAPENAFLCHPVTQDGHLLALLYVESPVSEWELPESLRTLPAYDAIESSLANALAHHYTRELLKKTNKELETRQALYEQSLAERRALEAQLKDANQKKSAFLTGISERIRRPMDLIEENAVRLSGAGTEPAREAFLREIVSGSRELREIISSILDFSRLEEREVAQEPSAFDLTACLEGSLAKFTPQAARKGLEVIYEIDPSVPLRVIGEESQLRQILDKLLRNAVQYTSEGEIHLSVSAKQEDILHCITFQVRDTGRGIAPEKLQTLFSRTWDEKNTEQSGLGLLITQRLCQLMGGGIRVTSEPGKGSIFEFYIKTLSVETQRPVHEYASILEGKRVLLVDDNITVRRVLRHELRMWRTFPMAAISGKAALELFSDSATRFSAAIIDMDMPQMTGARLIERIEEQARYQNMALILLINPLDDPSRYEYLKNEKYIVEILKKPIHPFVLQGLLIECLRVARDRLDHHKQGTLAKSLSTQRFD